MTELANDFPAPERHRPTTYEHDAAGSLLCPEGRVVISEASTGNGQDGSGAWLAIAEGDACEVKR